MHKDDFNYLLPEELIAQQPLTERCHSRLLEVNGANGSWHDRHFRDLPDLLEADDLLIFNDTRVIPARLYGEKSSGGRVEILIERITGERSAIAHLRASRSPQAGATLTIHSGDPQQVTATVTGRQENLFQLTFNQPLEPLLQRDGHIPLPPYLERSANAADAERYQTVFAKRNGAVAAPTAGLHFDEAMLATLKARGIESAFITLHVGAGTFAPVKVDDLRSHKMHAEWLEVSAAVVSAVKQRQESGRGRVIAIGTTVVRALESAAASGELRPFSGDTAIFIYPGYRFKVVDALLTNFHLPASTLLMLVSAFAGQATMLAAYRHAVAERYRFFSYGDAMLIHPNNNKQIK
ncbi:MAG: tRNA preQ1(34) S-adenosylmethionine ribosyltransferase-isomerase QueA [Gammaproteobacteria bacterium]|nr:tRNA preQ1(34) S-adenosylmethionine ribosyltransferase-isomerase QueA [Gammaproteobacteria bacterium]